ncbi:MAG: GNAT family N-acetyltransferase [Acidobacteria bacterium]|nr:GNAT family N-acetyltransferase [Acidobacteriota bacterium]
MPHTNLMLSQLNEPLTTASESWEADTRPLPCVTIGEALRVRRLSRGEEMLVLKMLRVQPVRNVVMIGLILDHGLESLKNRGIFYGCFSDGCLIGVALLGHHVLLAGGRECVECFARTAWRDHRSEIRLVLGEQSFVDEFCRLLDQTHGGPVACQSAPHVLLSLSGIEPATAAPANLRQARPGETPEIVRLNTDFFVELYGMNPTTHDPVGFRQRVLNRVERGRVWVAADDAGIAFKAEVVSATDDAVYLEGILTRPDARNAGLGSTALRALCGQLLRAHKTVCLLADADSVRANAFYRSVGFAPAALYRLIRYQAPIQSWQN